jgi:hypothetical protein
VRPSPSRGSLCFMQEMLDGALRALRKPSTKGLERTMCERLIEENLSYLTAAERQEVRQLVPHLQNGPR